MLGPHAQFRAAEARLAATDAGDDWTFQLRGLDGAPEAVARCSRQGDKGRAGIDELAALLAGHLIGRVETFDCTNVSGLTADFRFLVLNTNGSVALARLFPTQCPVCKKKAEGRV